VTSSSAAASQPTAACAPSRSTDAPSDICSAGKVGFRLTHAFAHLAWVISNHVQAERQARQRKVIDKLRKQLAMRPARKEPNLPAMTL